MSKGSFYLILLATLVVYIIGMRLDVMEVDAAQYAAMSWEMMWKKNFLQPTCLNQPYLDKPPLLFWLNSICFLLLGANNFSYKLPSLLFAMLGVYSTWRFMRIYYSGATARTGAVMLATTQAVFLITNDVRTDTLLMGAVIFSIWQWAQFFETAKTRNLLLGATGVALALLAKGPIGLIACGAAILPQLVWKGKLKQLLDWRLVVAVLWISLMLVPMSIGLYEQHGLKGLRFYYWTQSFGRITGESEWNNHPDTFFLVHTTAWAILPWTLFFFTGWIKSMYVLVKQKFATHSMPEVISLSGFTLVLISLMLSKYQLPHYVFVIFPLGCVMAARYFDEAMNTPKQKRVLLALQLILFAGLLVVAGFLQYAFMGADTFSLMVLGILIVLVAILFFRTRNWLYTSAAAIIAFNVLLGGFYLGAILKYQPENDFGRYLQANGRPYICFHYNPDFAFAFYSRTIPQSAIWNTGQFQSRLSETGPSTYILTSNIGLQEMKKADIAFDIVQERLSFKVSHLNWPFLNPQTRHRVCEKVYLVLANPR